VHARVEDAIRTGKHTGIGKFPSHLLALNHAWLAAALTAASLLAWLRMLTLDGDLAKAEPKTLRYRILHTAARIVHSGRRRHLKISATWPWAPVIVTAWNPSTPSPKHPDQHSPSRRSRKEGTRGPWNPRPRGPPAGPLSHPNPNVRLNPARRAKHPAQRQRSRVGVCGYLVVRRRVRW
jgi:DDE family transposase